MDKQMFTYVSESAVNYITLFHHGTAVMLPIKLKVFRCKVIIN